MDALTTLDAALSSRYAFEREIGRGGMAEVFLARDLKHGRRVAVKVLNSELAAIIGPERFLAEIRITANLQHPNLLPLFDSGEVGGLLYYVMPYVEGESLRARLNRERQLPVDDAVRIATSVAHALDHAHRHNVVHRDLKPENILLHDGEPVVADFGIALAVSNAGGTRITRTGLSLGTPQYMSPEQAMGDRAIDRRTDVFALGAVLYEMLVGEPPHAGATAQAVIAKILSDPARPVRDARSSVPAHVDAAIARALAKIPADRWATAAAFGAALNDGAFIPQQSVSRVRARGVRLKTAVPVAAALVLGALGALVATRRWARAQDESYAFVITLPDSAAVSTGSAGTGGDVSISRDGKTIAYLAGPAGGGDNFRGVWVRALDELVARPVRGAERGTVPRFSPDGKMLAYLRGGALYAIAVAGGTPIKLAEHASSYDWIDAGSVLFTDGTEMWAGSRNGTKLWICRSGESTPRLVVKPDSARGIAGVGFPSVLPGGHAALVTIWKGELGNAQREIAVASLDDGSITELGLAGSSPRYAVGQLVYVKDDGGLYAVPFSPSRKRVDGSPVAVIPQLVVKLTGWADFDVSDDGTLTYVAGSEARRRLVLVDRHGVATALASEIQRFYAPRVSPDGRTIAVETAHGLGFDIWTYDRVTRTFGPLTTDHRSFRPGGWADGGASVAYVSIDQATGIWQASIQPVNGRAPRRYVFPTSINTIDMSLGGDLIALRRGDGEILVGSAVGTAPPSPLVSAPTNAGIHALSRDGKYVAYQLSSGGPNVEIYAQSADGRGSRVQISSGGGREPAWSPRGDEIFYRGGDHLIAATVARDPLHVLRRDTLFRDTFLRYGYSANYDVMPNGQQFVMVQNENPDVYPTVQVHRLRRER